MPQASDLPTRSVTTPHGNVVITLSQAPPSTVSSSKNEPTLLLLHSNSSSSKAFRHILSRPPPGLQQVIAMDLPGHGLSPDAASNLDAAYTQRGYAESAVAVLQALAVTEVILLGWSLGGHIAIELVALLSAPSSPARCRGYMIIGTPPATGAVQFARGFDPSDASNEVDKQEEDKITVGTADGEEEDFIGGRLVWSEEVCQMFAVACHGQPQESWMVEEARRTDGRARKIMIAAVKAGTGVDQRGVVETSDVPCAVVNGGSEPFVNLGYLDRIKYKNLWEMKCHRIPGLGHAPFWQNPDIFQGYLDRFVLHCVTTT